MQRLVALDGYKALKATKLAFRYRWAERALAMDFHCSLVPPTRAVTDANAIQLLWPNSGI